MLEKLDEVGGIRMARHGSSSDPGETERQYLTGGIRTHVHKATYTRSQASLAALEQRLLNIAEYQPKVASALEAALELKKHRDEWSRKVRHAEKTREDGLKAAELKCKTVEECTVASVDEAESDYDQEKESLDAQINSWQKKLRRQLSRLSSLQKHLGKRLDTKSTTKLGFLRSLVDRVSPAFMASTGTLESRRENVEEKIAEFEELMEAKRVLLKKAVSQRDKLVNAAREELTRARKLRAEVSEDLKNKCESELLSLHLGIREQEGRLLPPQRGASTAADFCGVGCSGDEPDTYWKKLLHLLELDKTRSVKKCKFLGGWVRDLEADPTSVGQCYWDNLQVFFSTCVGIASWKEMVSSAQRFDFAVVDEAATVTTGETVMPLMYAKAGMLVGDEMQLPPHDPFEGKLCCDKCKPMLFARDKATFRR